jgi:excisionase family DNA binding protein
MEKRLLNVTELSGYLSLPKDSIYTMVSLKKLPGIVHLGRALRFEKAAIDRWVNEQALKDAASMPQRSRS